MWALNFCRSAILRQLKYKRTQFSFCSAFPSSLKWRGISGSYMLQRSCNDDGEGRIANTKKKIQMRIIPAKTDECLDYHERNLRFGRGLSPHLSIYRPQLTSVMSIMLRGTGMVLTVYVWTIGLIGLISSHDIDDYVQLVQSCEFSGYLISITKFMFALPFAYHFCNATRHLIWQLGLFLSKPEIYMTGYVTIAVTILFTIFLTLVKVEFKETEKKVKTVETAPKKDIKYSQELLIMKDKE